jgi:hypothetical protein
MRGHGGNAADAKEEENPSGCRPVAIHVGVKLRFALEGREVTTVPAKILCVVPTLLSAGPGRARPLELPA